MIKTAAHIYCADAECLEACRKYAESLHRLYLQPIVKTILVEKNRLNIGYYDFAPIEDTDIFDSKVQGFRDGWLKAKGLPDVTIQSVT